MFSNSLDHHVLLQCFRGTNLFSNSEAFRFCRMASPLGAPILTIPATRGWGSSIELQYKQIITYSNNNLN